MDIIAELTNQCTKNAKLEDKFYLKSDKIAAGIGVFVTELSFKLNGSHDRGAKSKCRYCLKKLEAAGKVVSKPTPGGATRWWVVGLAEKLIKTKCYYNAW